MGIKQFNGEWVPQEDRVLFRFNTHDNEEFSIWLTRHILHALLQGTQQLSAKRLENQHTTPEVAQAVQAFQQEVMAQNMDFGQTFQSGEKKPLGEQAHLVKGLVIQQSEEQTSIEFQMVNGLSLNMGLPNQVLQQMLILLTKLQETANWGTPSSTISIAADSPVDATPKMLH